MKITTQIDVLTQKRLVLEAITATETDIFGVLIRKGIDVDGFDENSYSLPADASEADLDLKKKVETLASLKSRLAKLG